MRYYVVSDTHGYFTELKEALTEKGFFTDSGPRKLIICGDIYDRGTEALAMQAFVLALMEKDEVILIRGNHEDLALHLLHEWHIGSYRSYRHQANGTVDTVCQLTGSNWNDLNSQPDEVGRKFLRDDYIQTIIPAMIDYYETAHYIFVHGWIPCIEEEDAMGKKIYKQMEDWREADEYAWNRARWINGMEAAHSGVIEEGKTIVCGHWHTSFGHCYYEDDGGEFDNQPNFNPYYEEGIIALDGCIPVSKKTNCIVIEDDEEI